HTKNRDRLVQLGVIPQPAVSFCMVGIVSVEAQTIIPERNQLKCLHVPLQRLGRRLERCENSMASTSAYKFVWLTPDNPTRLGESVVEKARPHLLPAAFILVEAYGAMPVTVKPVDQDRSNHHNED